VGVGPSRASSSSSHRLAGWHARAARVRRSARRVGTVVGPTRRVEDDRDRTLVTQRPAGPSSAVLHCLLSIVAVMTAMLGPLLMRAGDQAALADPPDDNGLAGTSGSVPSDPSSGDVTAVLSTVAGLRPPASGTITVDGQLLGSEPSPRRVAYLSQDHRLIGTPRWRTCWSACSPPACRAAANPFVGPKSSGRPWPRPPGTTWSSSCPVGSSNAWRTVERWCSGRRCWSSTTRPTRSGQRRPGGRGAGSGPERGLRGSPGLVRRRSARAVRRPHHPQLSTLRARPGHAARCVTRQNPPQAWSCGGRHDHDSVRSWV